MTAADPIGEVMALFDGAASALYGNERVTQRAHALQSAMQAEQDGAAPALVAAALLHDIGHLLAAAKHPDIGQQKDDLFNRIREVFKIGRMVRFDGPSGAYAHHAGRPKAALLEVSGGTAEAANRAASGGASGCRAACSNKAAASRRSRLPGRT